MRKKQSIKNENRKSNPFWDLFLLFFLIFLYFIPKEIAYPKYKYIDWLIFFLLFLILPYLVSKTIISTKFNKKYTNYGIALISIFIVVPTFLFVQNYRKKNELAEKGKITECYVIDRKKSKMIGLLTVDIMLTV